MAATPSEAETAEARRPARLRDLLWPRAAPPACVPAAAAGAGAGAADADAAARGAARAALAGAVERGSALPRALAGLVGEFAAAAVCAGGRPGLAAVEPLAHRPGGSGWRVDVALLAPADAAALRLLRATDLGAGRTLSCPPASAGAADGWEGDALLAVTEPTGACCVSGYRVDDRTLRVFLRGPPGAAPPRCDRDCGRAAATASLPNGVCVMRCAWCHSLVRTGTCTACGSPDGDLGTTFALCDLYPDEPLARAAPWAPGRRGACVRLCLACAGRFGVTRGDVELNETRLGICQVEAAAPRASGSPPGAFLQRMRASGARFGAFLPPPPPPLPSPVAAVVRA
jgi:hypothetical protein